MTKPPESVFRKAALILMAFVSLTIANANAGSAVVVSSNGHYAAAWGQLLNADQAMAKARDLCQKKGGTNVKVLVSADGAGPVVGSRRLFTSIAVSGSGPNAIVGVGLWLALPSQADASALANCREKGGTSPHLVAGWQERGLDANLPGTRAGKF
jgi:Domain of unknown function (DUF4189)